LEKTFFDYYLLGDNKKVLKFKEFDQQDNLNALEKCLLIDVLARSDNEEHKKQAKSIAKTIMEKEEASSLDDQEFNSRIFDLVLNLNSLN